MSSSEQRLRTYRASEQAKSLKTELEGNFTSVSVSGKVSGVRTAASESAYTVSELAEMVKTQLEGSFTSVCVRGEVSGVRTAASRHTYFTLKDKDAQISCAWFAGYRQAAQQRREIDERTGEVTFLPPVTPADLEEGGEFLIIGRVSFYTQRGTCEIVVREIRRSGVGALAQAFEERRQALEKLGYFAIARKRPLPIYPMRIALVTSESGAAIHDFLLIASTRGLSSRIRLYPTLVQGQEAVKTLASAISLVCAQGWAEVLVLIRGGGSLEDLWCFNEYPVVKAIYNATIPVLTGIGHEIDTTLADLTADVRAATPTHAAELLWQERTVLLRDFGKHTLHLVHCYTVLLANFARQVLHAEHALQLSSPKNRLNALNERYLGAHRALFAKILVRVQAKDRAFFDVFARLRACMAPERLDRRVSQVAFATQSMRQVVARMLEARDRARSELTNRLWHAIANILDEAKARLVTNAALLQSASPLALLERGYAIVADEAGQVVRSVHAVVEGGCVRIALQDGQMWARIERVEPETRWPMRRSET